MFITEEGEGKTMVLEVAVAGAFPLKVNRASRAFDDFLSPKTFLSALFS
jgi:hypothetical protein